MTKQQRTGLFVVLAGVVIFLISMTIKVNSGSNVFTGEVFHENAGLKKFFQFLGIGILLFGGIIYLSKKLNTKMILGSVLGVLGIILAIISIYGLITLAGMDDYELIEQTRYNLEKANSDLANRISNSELEESVRLSRKYGNISNIVFVLIGTGISYWGYSMFKKGKKQLSIAD